MSAAREKDLADYDLERFVEMFDEAMTSDDPRVKNALRQLMMMVILTDNSSDHEAERRRNRGPLRQICDDVRNIARKTNRLEEEVNYLRHLTSGLDRHSDSVPEHYSQSKDWPKGQALGMGDFTTHGISTGSSYNKLPSAALGGSTP